MVQVQTRPSIVLQQLPTPFRDILEEEEEKKKENFPLPTKSVRAFVV